MKTNEETKTLKEEVETLNRKLHELTEEELVQVTGGIQPKPTKGWFGCDLPDAEES